MLYGVYCALSLRPAEYVPDESGLNHVPEYDLDELDLGWLDTFRERRKYSGTCACVRVCVCVCLSVCLPVCCLSVCMHTCVSFRTAVCVYAALIGSQQQLTEDTLREAIATLEIRVRSPGSIGKGGVLSSLGLS